MYFLFLFQVSFDAGLGKKAIDAELKITNKQFRILNSYCEEKKECAHIEIDSKTNVDGTLMSFIHVGCFYYLVFY